MQALSASLLLHAVLLGSFVWQGPTPPGMPPAKIRLVVSPGTGQATAPPARSTLPPALPTRHSSAAAQRMQEAVVTQQVAQQTRESVRAPANVSLTTPAASPVRHAPAAASALAAHATGAAAGAAGAGEATVTAPASSNASAREGVSSDALRDYRMALAIEARRFKRYPPLARERGWEGTAEAAVTAITPGAPQVSLQRSSGYAALDEQTLDMLRRAALATPLPEALRGRDFRVVLPVRFSLDDDQ